jgi:hypothetical protein
MNPNLPTSLSVDAANPWPGLTAFTEDQGAYFHGRDEESREVGRRIERKTLTVLFGQSGLGKSSLLQAGVFPRLRAAGYCPIYVRLDHSPESAPLPDQVKAVVQFETRLAGTWSRPGSAIAGESLWEFFHHRDDVLQGGRGQVLTPVLIFDQFEELFTLGAAGDQTRSRADAFLAELADLVENRPPASFESRLEAGGLDAETFDFSRSDYRVLISLREDYLPHLESLRTAMPSLMQNRVRLTRLAGPAALDAVMKPAPGLVPEDVARAIVAFVAGRTDTAAAEVEPALLSLVCRELNSRRLSLGARTIDTALLEGSRETILTEFYERTVTDQPPSVRIFVEDELLTDSGYRENIALERARKLLGAAAASIDALVARRLLRIEERLDVRRIELTHDVLCGVVKASRDSRREREARAADERRQADAAAQLAEAKAGAVKARQQLIRARAIAAGCAVLAVLAAGSAVYGYLNQRRAEAAETMAEQNAAEAREAREISLTSRVDAERLLAYLLQDVAAEFRSSGDVGPARVLFDEVLGYYEKMPEAAHTPESRANQAVANIRASGLSWLVGERDRAEELRAKADLLLAQIPDSAAPYLRAEVETELLLDSSDSADVLADYASQANYARQGLARIQPVARTADASERSRFLEARAHERLGYALGRVGSSEAIEQYDAAADILRELIDEGYRTERTRVTLGSVVAWSSYAASNAGRDDEAIKRSDQAQQILAEYEQKDPANPILLGALSISQSSAIRAFLRQGRASEGEALITRYMDISRRNVAASPESNTPRNNYVVGQLNSARLRLMAGDVQGGMRELDADPEFAIGLRSGTTFNRFNLLVHYAARAELGAASGGVLPDAAADQQVLMELGEQLVRDAAADSSAQARARLRFASSRQNLSLAEGNYAEAAGLAEAALAVASTLEAKDDAAKLLQLNSVRNAHRSLGLVAVEAGRWEAAEQAFGQALVAELGGANDSRPDGVSLFSLPDAGARRAEFQAWQALAMSHQPGKADQAVATAADARRGLRALFDATDRSAKLMGVTVALSEIAWSRARIAQGQGASPDVQASLTAAQELLDACSPDFRRNSWVRRIEGLLAEARQAAR